MRTSSEGSPRAGGPSGAGFEAAAGRAIAAHEVQLALGNPWCSTPSRRRTTRLCRVCAGPDPRSRRHLRPAHHQRIRKGIRRISQLLDDLFELSRIDAGSLQLQLDLVALKPYFQGPGPGRSAGPAEGSSVAGARPRFHTRVATFRVLGLGYHQRPRSRDPPRQLAGPRSRLSIGQRVGVGWRRVRSLADEHPPFRSSRDFGARQATLQCWRRARPCDCSRVGTGATEASPRSTRTAAACHREFGSGRKAPVAGSHIDADER